MYRRVFIFVLCALSATARLVVDPAPKPVEPYIQNCATQHGVNYDALDSALTHFDETKITDSPMKCALACVLSTNGAITEDGHYNTTLVAEQLPSNVADREKVLEAFVECAKETAENYCETVFKSMVCLNNNMAFRTMHPVGTP